MTLVVGLGNPGAQYVKSPHNAGFLLLDLLLDGASRQKLSCQGELYKKNSLLLLKPMTYMNLSGESVLLVCSFYKPSRVVVLHDDLDLNFCSLRMKKSGSAAGHNGLKSIDAAIGADYERLRLGINPASLPYEAPFLDRASYVTRALGEDNFQVFCLFLKELALPALECLLADGLKAAQQRFNGVSGVYDLPSSN